MKNYAIYKDGVFLKVLELTWEELDRLMVLMNTLYPGSEFSFKEVIE